MILQALVRYYEEMLKDGRIAGPGWSKVNISFGLNLDEQGSVTDLLPLKAPQQRGKKTVEVPKSIELPQPVKRSVGIKANFLFDNSSYIFGVDEKGKADRSLQCFKACRDLHKKVLGRVETPAATAVLRYFATWKPEKITEYPCIMDHWKDIMSGANIALCFQRKPVVEDEEIKRSWQEFFDRDTEEEKIRCLVTGKEEPLERLHPSIKGVVGAQAMGTSLVSFNAPAFCSYGKEQGANASVGKYAAFAYTAALNELLSDGQHAKLIGDTTVVCWAENAQREYQDLTMAALFGMDPESGIQEEDLIGALEAIRRGDPVTWEDKTLKPDQHFYILGLAPNAARLIVRFFLVDSFGNVMSNIARHYEDISIVKPKGDKEILPAWKLLYETVNENARNKTPSPQMAADTMQAILSGGKYPKTLLNGVMLRIRADREVTRGRAAIIKAFYIRNENKDCPKEVLKMELNEQCTDVPYTLGRLFAVLENLQKSANPGINATIKDKYFNSASAIPVSVFPTLLNLAQKHLKKLVVQKKAGLKVFYDEQIEELLFMIGKTYPAHLNLAQQGAFQLGYYHQRRNGFQKKEEEVNE